MKVCSLKLQNSRIEGIEIWRYRSEHHHYRIIASSRWMMWENIWEDLTKIFDVRLEFGAVLLLVWFWMWFVPIMWCTLLRYLVTVTARLLSRIKHSRLIEQSFYTTRQADWMKLGLTELNRQDNVTKLLKKLTKLKTASLIAWLTVILLMVVCDLKIMIKISSIIQQIIMPSSYIIWDRGKFPCKVFRSHLISAVSEVLTGCCQVQRTSLESVMTSSGSDSSDLM